MGILNSLFKMPNSVRQLLNEGAIIVDVRTPQEYNAGHIKGSKNIPLDSLKNRWSEVEKMKKPVITVCQSGMRSGTAKSFLESKGLRVANGGSWSGLNKLL